MKSKTLHLIHRLTAALHYGWKYFFSATAGFAVEFAVIFVLYSLLTLPYLVAIALGFVGGTTLHYLFCRIWVFKGTRRTVKRGYVYYLAIIIFNLLMVTLAVWLMVEFLNLSPYTARLVSVILFGFGSFFLNARYNFRML